MKNTFFLLLFLCSCGYHAGTGALAERYTTISVPYAKGDNQGLFTKALIDKVCTQSQLTYVNMGGDLLLKVCIPSAKSENVGFRYSPKNPKVVVANEGRFSQEATVTLTDCKKKCTVLGPFTVKATFDFDFESDSGTINEHAFSLGQFEMNPLAKDAATCSLYNLLAEKIVDYVNNSW